MSVLVDTWEMLTSLDRWTGPRGILQRGAAHLWISLVATAIAAAIALPSAVLLAHRRILPVASVAWANVARAIPSFALIALVYPFSIRYGFGLGFWPTCVALVALGIPPMYTNAYAGVEGAPAEIVEAARGIGMTERQVLTGVELPAAMPLIAAGVRVAVVQIVATATLGALVGYDCLGSYIVAGLRRGPVGRPEVLGGAILVAGLALVLDVAMSAAQPRLFPWQKRVQLTDGRQRG